MSFSVGLEPQTGGRWASLRDPVGREWLWSRPDERRLAVGPQDTFVDVGGVEECFPTLVGASTDHGRFGDHGDAWSRPWTVDGATHRVTTGALTLHRTVVPGPRVVARYEVTGPPGHPFVWVWHALLVPEPGCRLHLAEGPVRTWPDGFDRPPRRSTWPRVGGTARFDRLGADDGTAQFALLPDRDRAEVVTSAGALTVELRPTGALPTAVGIWRNLGGHAWDGGAPYRSLGVEPMIGRSPSVAGPAADVAVVPPTGRAAWTLTISHRAAVAALHARPEHEEI